MRPPPFLTALQQSLPPPSAAGEIVECGGRIYVASHGATSAIERRDGLAARAPHVLPPIASDALVWREAAQFSLPTKATPFALPAKGN